MGRPTPLIFEELLNLRVLRDVDVSSDGRHVAVVVGERDEPSHVWIGDPSGTRTATCKTSGRGRLPRFSPDGRLLAFAADLSSPGFGEALYVLEIGHGCEARTIGELAGCVESIDWSRDGDRLLVIVADPGADLAGVQGAMSLEWACGDGRDPIVRRPGQGRRRLYCVDLATGTTSEVGPTDVNIWEVGWNGDGAAVAVVSTDPREGAWYRARIALLDVQNRRAQILYDPVWQVQSPVVSSDARYVAFVEGIASDRTVVSGTATVLDMASGRLHALAADRDFVALRWLDQRPALFGVGIQGLETMCAEITLDGEVRELWRGAATLGRSGRIAAACSADGRVVAATVEAPDRPPELAVLEGETWRPVTHVNVGLRGRTAPTARRFAWTAHDGVEIEGILLMPDDRPDERLPLIVAVHGGPTSAWTFSYDPGRTGLPVAWAIRGHAVLLPNPRGSAGRGQAFARANIGDLGGEDLQDILAGVAALIEAGIADHARIGIAGASYGGFMSAWATTQCDAFSASVPFACISDWPSFQRTSNIGFFADLFLQSRPAEMSSSLTARSPVTHAHACTTPTLILHGALDLCTPVGQAYALYQALVDAKCATELVVYPGSGHTWTERDHLIDVFKRSSAWFDVHLSPSEAPIAG